MSTAELYHNPTFATKPEILRCNLASVAGITDLAMLRFFSTLDARIESGEIQTTDITGLSDEELLSMLCEPDDPHS